MGLPNSPYLRADNFLQGDFHKVIFVDSPQFGSRITNCLLRFIDTSIGQVIHDNVLVPELKMNARKGAAADLQEGSAAILGMPPTPTSVPIHAIVGRGGRDAIVEVRIAGGLAPSPHVRLATCFSSSFWTRQGSRPTRCGRLETRSTTWPLGS